MTCKERLRPGALARLGEDLAARWLEELGYTILERNRRFRNGEIDVVARDGHRIVFVEVKTRSGPRFLPCESVDGRKQRKLHALALQWMADSHCLDLPCRFDVIAVYLRRDPPYDARIEHIERAF